MPTNLKNYLTLPNLFLIDSALLFRCMDQALELVAEMIYECEVASKNWSTYFGIRSHQAKNLRLKLFTGGPKKDCNLIRPIVHG